MDRHFFLLFELSVVDFVAKFFEISPGERDRDREERAESTGLQMKIHSRVLHVEQKFWGERGNSWELLKILKSGGVSNIQRVLSPIPTNFSMGRGGDLKTRNRYFPSKISSTKGYKNNVLNKAFFCFSVSIKMVSGTFFIFIQKHLPWGFQNNPSKRHGLTQAVCGGSFWSTFIGFLELKRR